MFTDFIETIRLTDGCLVVLLFNWQWYAYHYLHIVVGTVMTEAKEMWWSVRMDD